MPSDDVDPTLRMRRNVRAEIDNSNDLGLNQGHRNVGVGNPAVTRQLLNRPEIPPVGAMKFELMRISAPLAAAVLLTVLVLSGASRFQMISWNTPAEQVFQYLNWNNSRSCALPYDFSYGHVMADYQQTIDSRQVLCMDPGVALEFQNCLVCTLGIHTDRNVNKMFQNFGCHVMAFDQSAALFRILEHSKVIDYLELGLKEWNALEQILQRKSLTKVKQLAVHIGRNETEADLLDNIRILKELEAAGMIRFTSRIVNGINHKISWYNKRFKS